MWLGAGAGVAVVSAADGGDGGDGGDGAARVLVWTDGGGDQMWENADNWNATDPPSRGDHCIVNAIAGDGESKHYPVVAPGTFATCGWVTGNGTVMVHDASLVLEGPQPSSLGKLEIDGDSLEGDGAHPLVVAMSELLVGELVMRGNATLAGSGMVVVDTKLSVEDRANLKVWTEGFPDPGGDQDMVGVLIAGEASVTCSSPPPAGGCYLNIGDRRQLVNKGTLTLGSNTLVRFLKSGTGMENDVTGVVHLQGNVTLLSGAEKASVANSGHFMIDENCKIEMDAVSIEQSSSGVLHISESAELVIGSLSEGGRTNDVTVWHVAGAIKMDDDSSMIMAQPVVFQRGWSMNASESAVLRVDLGGSLTIQDSDALEYVPVVDVSGTLYARGKVSIGLLNCDTGSVRDVGKYAAVDVRNATIGVQCTMTFEGTLHVTEAFTWQGGALGASELEGSEESKSGGLEIAEGATLFMEWSGSAFLRDRTWVKNQGVVEWHSGNVELGGSPSDDLSMSTFTNAEGGQVRFHGGKGEGGFSQGPMCDACIASEVANYGKWVVSNPFTLASVPFLNEDTGQLTVTGTGTLTTDVRNDSVRPRFSQSATLELYAGAAVDAVGMPWTFHSTSKTIFHAASATEYSTLTLKQDARAYLRGVVTLVFDGGFEPAEGDTFDLCNYADSNGLTDLISEPDLPSPKVLSVVEHSGTGRLEVTILTGTAAPLCRGEGAPRMAGDPNLYRGAFAQIFVNERVGDANKTVFAESVRSDLAVLLASALSRVYVSKVEVQPDSSTRIDVFFLPDEESTCSPEDLMDRLEWNFQSNIAGVRARDSLKNADPENPSTTFRVQHLVPCPASPSRYAVDEETCTAITNGDDPDDPDSRNPGGKDDDDSSNTTTVVLIVVAFALFLTVLAGIVYYRRSKRGGTAGLQRYQEYDELNDVEYHQL